MASTRQPLRKSVLKSKTAIAERKNRPKKVIRRTVTITESTIVTVGNVQKENKVEVSFAADPNEVVEMVSAKKKKKSE
jgi:hypothetical protein